MKIKLFFILKFICILPVLAGNTDENQKWHGDFEGWDFGGKYEYDPYSQKITDDIRDTVSTLRSGKEYKKFGLAYKNGSYYYSQHKQKGYPFVGNRRFEVIKRLEEDLAGINCFGYALKSFGATLEALASEPMNQIIENVKSSIDEYVERYFEEVQIPQDGDLAVYSIPNGKIILGKKGEIFSGTTHAGIFREGKLGGTIESKWGWLLNPYVFNHDAFFAPDFYGSIITFYRLKNS